MNKISLFNQQPGSPDGKNILDKTYHQFEQFLQHSPLYLLQVPPETPEFSPSIISIEQKLREQEFADLIKDNPDIVPLAIISGEQTKIIITEAITSFHYADGELEILSHASSTSDSSHTSHSTSSSSAPPPSQTFIIELTSAMEWLLLRTSDTPVRANAVTLSLHQHIALPPDSILEIDNHKFLFHAFSEAVTHFLYHRTPTSTASSPP